MRVAVELSEEEMTVLRLLSGGCDNYQISRRMGVSRSTVKRITVRVQSKLGATTRTQAVFIAAKQGLI
jgi:DNA-binding NarL/FixJ family response regulator